MQRFRAGLAVKALRLCASLHSRLEGYKEEEEVKLPGQPSRSKERLRASRTKAIKIPTLHDLDE